MLTDRNINSEIFHTLSILGFNNNNKNNLLNKYSNGSEAEFTGVKEIESQDWRCNTS